MNQATKYFVQTDMGIAYAYYRQRYENNGLYEEIWQQREEIWQQIPWRLIWMVISGECTLEQVSYERFKQLLPEAFDMEGDSTAT